MDYKKIAGEVIAGAKELAELKDKKLGAEDVAALAVKAVETYAEEKALSSEDKKGIATAIISELAEELPEAKKVSNIIDLIVRLLNAIFGKGWLRK